MKILIILSFVLFFAILQYKLWFGKGSYQELNTIQAMIVQQQAENDLLQRRNKKLMMEVNTLKQELDAVEEYARSELGMIKRNEVYYQIVE